MKFHKTSNAATKQRQLLTFTKIKYTAYTAGENLVSRLMMQNMLFLSIHLYRFTSRDPKLLITK